MEEKTPAPETERPEGERHEGETPEEKTHEGEALASLRYADKKEVCRGGVLGVFLGLAIIVPGVSGSAVAILFGLYEKLLCAFGNLFSAFGRCVRYLLPVAIGAAAGLLVGFFGVRALLDVSPFALVGLFAGLMLGAWPAVRGELSGACVTPPRAALFAAGLLFPPAMACVSVFAAGGSVDLSALPWYACFAFLPLGAAVALTQLVPGLSATALLLALGCFQPLLDSVSLSFWAQTPLVFLVYLCLAAGFLLGLVFLSKGMNALLSRARTPAFFVIAGLALGSVATLFFNPEMLAVYESWANGAPFLPDLPLGIALFAAGTALSYWFCRRELRAKKRGGADLLK